MEKFKFLEVGRTWNQSIIRINSVPESEELWSESIIAYYECIGKENITTKAGCFECYAIKEEYGYNSTWYDINYFSPSVKNVVLSKHCESWGEVWTKKELISTSYIKKSPSFEFILFIFAVVILLVVYAKIKND